MTINTIYLSDIIIKNKREYFVTDQANIEIALIVDILLVQQLYLQQFIDQEL